MNFTAFDTKKIDEYAKQAKEQWGQTKEYKECAEKTKNWTADDKQAAAEGMMVIFAELGRMKEVAAPDSEEAQAQVKKLQDYITEHFYTCSKQILASLSEMYAGGGEMTENIDKAGGEGTGEFAGEAVRVYCME